MEDLFEQGTVTQHPLKRLESRINADGIHKSAKFITPGEKPWLLTPAMSGIFD